MAYPAFRHQHRGYRIKLRISQRATECQLTETPCSAGLAHIEAIGDNIEAPFVVGIAYVNNIVFMQDRYFCTAFAAAYPYAD